MISFALINLKIKSSLIETIPFLMEDSISFYARYQLLFIGIAPINKPKASGTKELKFLANKFQVMFKDELTDIQEKDVMIYEKFRKEF